MQYPALPSEISSTQITCGKNLFLEPMELIAGMAVAQISCGHSFTLALTNDGIVHSFGKNNKGQLGTRGSMMVDIYMVDMYAMSSVPIEGQLENRNVVKISAGHSHSSCVTDKGELFLWGMNIYHEPMLVTSVTRVRFFSVKYSGENFAWSLPYFFRVDLSLLPFLVGLSNDALVHQCRLWRKLDFGAVLDFFLQSPSLTCNSKVGLSSVV